MFRIDPWPAAALALVSGLLLLASAAGASTIVISATDSGWYDDTGSHSQSSENYIVGWRGAEYRNFFVFDLTTAIPLGQTVVGATLRLWNPAVDPPNVFFDGYRSPDPSETYELVHVATPVPLLLAGGSFQLTTYQDLADGSDYGTRAVSAADNGTNVEIALNAAAIADIDAALGLFAIGGHVTTLTSGSDVEFAFGSTGENSLRELVIETVPEPATGALVGLGLVALARRRSSRLRSPAARCARAAPARDQRSRG